MCPMRVFLVLFSAILACYLAFRNYSNDEELSIHNNESDKRSQDSTVAADESAPRLQIYSKVSSSLWTLVDMASGRYLWRGMKSLDATAESKGR